MNPELIQFESHIVHIERKPFRRSVTIFISANKPITVRAGIKTPKIFIEQFLSSKKEWIDKNVKKFSELKEKNPIKKIKHDETFPFMGQFIPMKVVITPNKKKFISFNQDSFLLHIPMNDWSAACRWQEFAKEELELLRNFYKKSAVALLTEKIKFWADAMKLQPTEIKFREPKRRWGSCSSRGVINLNWRLIVFSSEMIDYVLIHELAHLKFLDHSSNFWNLVQQFCPDYKKLSKQLKENQLQCDFLNLK